MLNRVAIGMIVRDDAESLALTLPSYTHCAQFKIAIDFGSMDNGRDLLKANGFEVFNAVWRQDYAHARNTLLAHAARRFPWCEWLLMLDADEAIDPKTAWLLDEFDRTTDAVVGYFNRINLVGREMAHWHKSNYPDPQGRLIKLNSMVKYKGAVHECPFIGDVAPPIVKAPVHIYHYGLCRDPKKVWLRHHNYGLIQRGLQPLEEAPDNLPADIDKYLHDMSGVVAFGEWHPLSRRVDLLAGHEPMTPARLVTVSIDATGNEPPLSNSRQ